MSKQKISIFDMEKSNLEFKKSHYVSVSGFKPQTDKIPEWFNKFHEEEFKPLQEAVVRLYTEPPKWFIEFQKQVLGLFNQVFTRLDKIDSRIDNLVAKNNLKE